MDCGEQGVRKLMVDTFAETVKANDGYAAELESFTPLSPQEADDIGLQRHTEDEVTWYRLEGSALQTPKLWHPTIQ